MRRNSFSDLVPAGLPTPILEYEPAGPGSSQRAEYRHQSHLRHTDVLSPETMMRDHITISAKGRVHISPATAWVNAPNISGLKARFMDRTGGGAAGRWNGLTALTFDKGRSTITEQLKIISTPASRQPQSGCIIQPSVGRSSAYAG